MVGRTDRQLDNSVAVVTGGAGFIGSHVVEELLVRGASHVIVLDNFFLGTEDNLTAAQDLGNVSLIRGDASDLQTLLATLGTRSVDYLFDMAVVPLPTSIDFPSWSSDMNVKISLAASEATRLGLVGKLVHVSSSEVYGSASSKPLAESDALAPLTPYAASKASGDLLVNSYACTFGIESTTVRPFNNFGPRQNARQYAGLVPRAINHIIADEPLLVYGNGEQTRDFTFVKRTAGWIVDAALLRHEGVLTINVASGFEVSVLEMLDMIRVLMGAPDHPVRFLPQRVADVDRHIADLSTAKELLGVRETSIREEELLATIDWYRSRR